MALSLIFNKIPRGQINGLTLDAVLSENNSFTSTVTENPVEDGKTISDNIINDPYKVNMAGIISDTPPNLLGIGSSTSGSKSKAAFDLLVNARDQKQLFNVVTGFKVYQNMAFTNLDSNRDKDTGQSLNFTSSMTQIDKVGSKTVEIPAEQVKDQPAGTQDQAASEEDKGDQVPVEPTDQQSSIAFDILGKAVGL